jgi:hypothetical protein
MLKANKQWVRNRLISSSLSNQKWLMESLSYAARQAYFLRDYARLEIIGERLVNLSPRSEHIGRWYLALANRNLWKGDTKELTLELESLADSAPLPVRIIAMGSLTGLQINSNQADKATVNLMLEASNLALKCDDLLSFLHLQTQYSELCSIKGDHLKSLEILRGLKPAVDRLGSFYNITKSVFYNNVAWELLQLGEHEAAACFIKFPLHSIHLSAYPEWQETALEINQAFPKKNNIICPPSQIFQGYFNPGVFEEYLEKRAFFSEPAVRTLPIAKHETEPNLSVYLGNRRFSQILLSQNIDTAQEAMQLFMFGADDFSSSQPEKGTVLFETFFCSNGMYSPICEHSIRLEYLGLFYDLIQEANGINKDKPAPPTPPGSTRMENAETRKTVRWLMPRLEKSK